MEYVIPHVEPLLAVGEVHLAQSKTENLPFSSPKFPKRERTSALNCISVESLVGSKLYPQRL
jgi:hypothetical protein